MQVSTQLNMQLKCVRVKRQGDVFFGVADWTLRGYVLHGAMCTPLCRDQLVSRMFHLLLPRGYWVAMCNCNVRFAVCRNDGFAGGSTVAGNLVFNMVRETGTWIRYISLHTLSRVQTTELPAVRKNWSLLTTTRHEITHSARRPRPVQFLGPSTVPDAFRSQ